MLAPEKYSSIIVLENHFSQLDEFEQDDLIILRILIGIVWD